MDNIFQMLPGPQGSRPKDLHISFGAVNFTYSQDLLCARLAIWDFWLIKFDSSSSVLLLGIPSTKAEQAECKLARALLYWNVSQFPVTCKAAERAVTQVSAGIIEVGVSAGLSEVEMRSWGLLAGRWAGWCCRELTSSPLKSSGCDLRAGRASRVSGHEALWFVCTQFFS